MQTSRHFFFGATLVAALFTLTSRAELLVYDGIPTAATPGTGTAYTAADLRSTGNVSQNPTHSTIIGETGGWSAGSAGTGTIKGNVTTNLVYPAGVNLSSIGGSICMTSGGNPDDKTPNRSMGRAIRDAASTLARKSFFATVLIAYDDLSAYPNNAFGGWGLTKGSPTYNVYPTGGGMLVGFRKDASATSTGVSAVLNVAGTYYVIRRDVAPGTHLFALRFQYSDTDAEIISATLLDNGAEPSLSGGGWSGENGVTVTNALLTSIQNFGWLSVGYNYNIANKNIYVDEWRVGTEWRDVAGETAGVPCVVNAGLASGTDAAVTGMVARCGASATTVRVYYGLTDGTDDPGAWERWHEFDDPATEDGQIFSFAPANLVSGTNYFFRFSASTPGGEVFAPWTDMFVTLESVPVTFSTPRAESVTKSGATIVGEMMTGYPLVTVTACIDIIDHGTESLPGDWAKTAASGSHAFGGALSAAFTGLSAGTEYVARFYGTNDTGSVWSDAITFTTQAPTLTVNDRYFKKGARGVIATESVPVTLDLASARPVTFRYYTVQATEAKCENALPGVHYVNETNTVVIPPGVTQTNLTVRIIGNDLAEFPGKRFYLRFDSVDGATTPGTTEIGTLCDNMGKRIFHADFTSGAPGWTPNASGNWSVSSGRYTCTSGGGKSSRAGEIDMKDYGFRVMAMARPNNNSYQNWSIFAYNRQSEEGGGAGYKFKVGNTTGTGAYIAQLLVNGTTVAGSSNGGMAGSRLGWNPVMRPLSMRITPTRDGHNRIQCWAGYYKAVDYIDESGQLLDGGQIGLANDSWYTMYYDDVEVFANHPRTTILIVR